MNLRERIATVTVDQLEKAGELAANHRAECRAAGLLFDTDDRVEVMEIAKQLLPVIESLTVVKEG